jgi:hypothetical protein
MVKFSMLLGVTLAVGGTATNLQSRGWSGTNLGQCQGKKAAAVASYCRRTAAFWLPSPTVARS